MQSKSIQVHVQEEERREKTIAFIQKANEFECKITISGGSYKVNAKSMMGVLSIGLYSGQMFELRAEGADEQAAIEALMAFLEQE